MKYAIEHRPLCVPAGSMWRHDWLQAVARAELHRAPYRYFHP
jgi:hypothetical protein